MTNKIKYELISDVVPNFSHGRRNGFTDDETIQETRIALSDLVEHYEENLPHDASIELPDAYSEGMYLVKDINGNYKDALWKDGHFWTRKLIGGPRGEDYPGYVKFWWILPRL